MTDSEALPHNIPDDSVEPEAEAAPTASAEPDAAPDPPTPTEPNPTMEPTSVAGSDPAPEPGPSAPAQPDPRPSPVFAAPLPPTEPVAPAAPGPDAATSAEIKLLRLEIAHRDQLLLTARERRLGLEREIGRLERQLDVAIEEQREAATERAELRRLLGNVQMQVQSLLQLPAPAAEPEDAEDAPPPVTADDEPAPESARPRTAESIVYAQAAPATEHEAEEPAEPAPPAPSARRPRPRRGGLMDDARDVLSGLRRFW